MPMLSEGISLRSRSGFQEASDADSVRCSPALFKSASKHCVQPSGPVVEREDTEISEGSALTFELQEDPSFWKDHNVQVVIRVRPLSSSEISLQGRNKCVRQDSCQTITWTGHPECRFTFDMVADENVSQENLFKVAGLPMVENCMGGYNSCMFAYGQTGSGKTYTMLGDIEGGTRRNSIHCGMTPRVFEHLFSRIQKEKESRRDEKLRFTCKCSFLEIYNELILDLLDPSSTNLQIREDAKKGVYVENLTEFEVSSARDVIQQLLLGAANRKVASTNMNHASSRSHSVFTCVIESEWESQGVTHHRFARLNLVDLAGSERQKSSGAEGERLKEATSINKSLSTLGLVIMNLVSISNGKSQHVPYRDSKLTFLLQESLGGNSKTTIIANISPSNCCALETLSTLKFAQRAKFIRNNAIVNEDASGDVLNMRMQIQQLKKEVNRLRGLVKEGAENQENDNCSVSLTGSPGSFKWDGGFGSFTPLASEKRPSKRKDVDAVLVGALRREHDKDMALKALTSESEAAMKLAKQREEEIQSLKMRLRFREEGIKRLEAVASGKISAEAHLLQEKSELLKEIEVLRSQVDRNQEVTRFAMENLRLKEELRRLQSFYEDGGQEVLNEQIKMLENKLLEALDWKLMHENQDRSGMMKSGISDSGMLVHNEDHLLVSNKVLSSSWDSSINEENEFLRLQEIQNQKEVEALRKNLNFCLEAKEKLERRVDDLTSELEELRRDSTIKNISCQDLLIDDSISMKTADPILDSSNDPLELKALVDAIAVASQREAEAHETAINLAKENEELRSKLKVLIEDNNKLIELYEGVAAEGSNRAQIGHNTEIIEDNGHNNHEIYHLETKDVEHLEHQLNEMHEENEKLMGLYEKAMQERDEYKRMVLSCEMKNAAVEEQCPEKVVEADERVLHEKYDENIGMVEVPSKSGEYIVDNGFNFLRSSEIAVEENCPKELVEADKKIFHEEYDENIEMLEVACKFGEDNPDNGFDFLTSSDIAVEVECTKNVEADENVSYKEYDENTEMVEVSCISGGENKLNDGFDFLRSGAIPEEDHRPKKVFEAHEKVSPEKYAENIGMVEVSCKPVEIAVEENCPKKIIEANEEVLHEEYDENIEMLEVAFKFGEDNPDDGFDFLTSSDIAVEVNCPKKVEADEKVLHKEYDENTEMVEVSSISGEDKLNNRFDFLRSGGIPEEDHLPKKVVEADENVSHEKYPENIGMIEVSFKPVDIAVEENCPKKIIEANEKVLHEEHDDFMDMVQVSCESGEDIPNNDSDFLRFSDIDGKIPDAFDFSSEEGNASVVGSRNLNVLPKSASIADAKVPNEELHFAKMKLEAAQDKLTNAAKAVCFIGLLEKANASIEKLTREIEDAERAVQVKQQEMLSLKSQSSQIMERKCVVDSKLLALKSSVSNFCCSVDYWEQRERRVKEKVDASSKLVDQKREELRVLQEHKDEAEAAHAEAQNSEMAIRNDIELLESKLQDAEKQRQTQKTLLEINNVDDSGVLVDRAWNFSKASELLRFEEERTRLAAEIKQAQEKSVRLRREIKDLARKSSAFQEKIEDVSVELAAAQSSLKETEAALEGIIHEKKAILEMSNEGRRDAEKMASECQQCVFEMVLKEEETIICDEEIWLASRSLEGLRTAKMAEIQKRDSVLEDERHVFQLLDLNDLSCHSYVSGKVEEVLADVQRSIREAKSCLVGTD